MGSPSIYQVKSAGSSRTMHMFYVVADKLVFHAWTVVI